MTYPNLNIDPESLKIKTRDDENKKLKISNKNYDHEMILKSLEIDNEYYKKKYKSLTKKNVILIITEILVGAGSPVGSSTRSLINPGAGIIIISTALPTSIAVLLNVIILLYENTLKESMIDNKTDQKEVEQLKQVYNHYFDKRK